MNVKTVVTAMMAGFAAVAISAAPQLAAETPQEHQHAATDKAATDKAATDKAATDKAKPASDMMARCKAMMAERERMMTGMKAADQRLDDLVAKMNAASGMEKTDAAAAVVNEMVAQRRAMRDGMAKTQQGMMGHMTEHMQAGKAGKDSVARCPMMKQMGEKQG